ncbi:AEC family transporter [Brenneria corticis]|uniref:AEC family transporter n=1 Tax=Brenneria corticis TaxID=2173106 RepID=A0A2U1TLK6_9GAMM|nr:AEC family transporter [Brenneria sp. CFCC 11842]PWC10287.1 AEC family transporter [Brenneria sp. CFCC 11842]
MISEVVVRVLFLIFIAGLGWGMGAKLKMSSKDISALLIYVISPFVIFVSILQSPADWTYFRYSLGALLTASIAASIAYFLARFIWDDGRVNLFSFAGGTGNTGYFALPLVFALFNETQVAVAIFIIIGINLYEFSVGYFIAAKGVLNTKESLGKIVRLPILYAAIIGMVFKGLGIDLGDVLLSGMSNFKGAYSVLGMMVIGITLASYRKVEVDWSFLVAAIGWKHLVYPIAGGTVFHLLMPTSLETLAVIALMLATPMAGNTVVIANSLGVHPEKAAFSVMVSTVLAVVTVPLAVAWVHGLAG